MTTLLDPTSEQSPGTRERAPRPATLDHATIGLLDITKARGDVFLDRIAENLVARGHSVLRFAKPTFSKPAPIDLRQQIASSCEVLIEALAD